MSVIVLCYGLQVCEVLTREGGGAGGPHEHMGFTLGTNCI